MATFKVKQTIETELPELRVETQPPLTMPLPELLAQQLRPGKHRFQLVVVDDKGNRSAPMIAEILVLGST